MMHTYLQLPKIKRSKLEAISIACMIGLDSFLLILKAIR